MTGQTWHPRSYLVVIYSTSTAFAPGLRGNRVAQHGEEIPKVNIGDIHDLHSRQTLLETNTNQANGPAPAIPRQGNNPPGPAPGNNAALNNPLGNPLGLFGRFFGPPGQPAQAANPLPNAPARAVQNQGIHDQHNPIMIQYHINNQTPTPGSTGAGQNNILQRPSVIQPIQPLDGFVGPNGVWQRWPGDRDNTENTNSTPLNQSVPDAGMREGSPVPAALVREQTEGTSSNNEDPRVAAAIAAMRRVDGKESPSSSKLSSSVEDHGTQKAHMETSSAPAVPSQVPKWIPLFDLSMTRLHTSTNMSAPETTHSQPSSIIRQKTSLSHLPEQISDAQLARLDNLTREAIDERLQILENVSGIVDQCVENLLKVRSALPVIDGNFQDTNLHIDRSHSSTSEFDTSKEGAHSRDKGKGVDRGSENRVA